MDRAVQRTDQDALGSKQSAVLRHYYKDVYIADLCGSTPPHFRLPLINIGTYCRVWSVDQLVEEFLDRTSHLSKRCIVSLGAGSDTRAFNVLAKEPSGLTYHEIDFPKSTMKKCDQIHRSAIIRKAIKLDGPITEPGEIHTSHYHLHGVDLRKLREYSHTIVEREIPTLIISECCLCYLKPEESNDVLQYFVENVGGPAYLSCVMYEPIGLDDEFGRVMAVNLAERGLSLPSFKLYSTIEKQKQRLRDLGLESAGAASIEDVYKKWLDPHDRERVSRLEFLDEVEEMDLLLRHYCTVWAWGSSLPPLPSLGS